MAGWFTNLIPFIPGNDILASEVDGKLNAISSSLNDHLPTPRADGVPGFQAPCAVGDPSESYHAVPYSKVQGISVAIDSGVANAYQLTPEIMPSSYTDGYEICFKPLHTNTGTSTAQVGALGFVPLKKANGQNLSPGDLSTDSYASFRFNGTEFRTTGLLAGDAYSGMAYMRSDVAAQGGIGGDVGSSSVDWNSIDVAVSGCSHFVLLGNAPNGPGDNNYYYSFTFEYSHKNGSGNMTQLAVGYNTNKMYMRYRYHDEWSPWVNLMTGGSNGSVKLEGRRVEWANSDYVRVKAGLKIYMKGSKRMCTLSSDVNVGADGPLAEGTWFLFVKDNGSLSSSLLSSDFELSMYHPVYDSVNNGWYHNNDRCIGFFFVNSGNQLVEFNQCQNKITLAPDISVGGQPYNIIIGNDSGSGLVYGGLSLGFAVRSMVNVHYYISPINNTDHHVMLYYCKNSSTRSMEIMYAYNSAEPDKHGNISVVTESNGNVNFCIENHTSTHANAYLRLFGYTFPDGM